jgi:Fe-S oxidoreductase
VLYTGLMYQLMPSLMALQERLSKFEDSSLTRLFGVGRVINRALNVSRFTPLLARRQDQERFDGILRDIALLLRAAGVEFGYLYEEELYAGALGHDEGLCRAFEQQALRVRDLLRRHGVRRVITVDPHTTNVLRSVYPAVIGGDGIEVQSYLEVLVDGGMRPRTPTEQSAAIHDSCVYARHEGIVDEPRRLLETAGIEAREPEASGKGTFCCGGPIESLFPGKAHAIAKRRLAQLTAVSSRVVTMCPVCLVNLREAAAGQSISVEDIAGWLAEAGAGNGDDLGRVYVRAEGTVGRERQLRIEESGAVPAVGRAVRSREHLR